MLDRKLIIIVLFVRDDFLGDLFICSNKCTCDENQLISFINSDFHLGLLNARD